MVRGSVVIMSVLVATRALAGPVRLDVKFDACPDLADEVRAVAAFDPTAAASVVVTERARVATIVIDDGHGQVLGSRTVEAASCRELATSVAIIVAMSLSSISDASEPAIAVEPVVVASPPPVPEPPSTLELVAHAPAVAGVARVAIGMSLSVSSALGEVAAIGARWHGDRFSIGSELAAARLPEVGLMAGARVDVSRFAIAAVPCAHHGALGLCGVVRAGFDRGRGTGLADARTVELPVLELGGRLIWERPVTDWFALQLQAELAAALTSSELTVDQVAVWHSSRYEALAGAAVFVRFP
jgi:hypothetical protein